ncbi:hypothetical protein SERLA73DRAFT_157550 [Serpula lacrymans var. lacrymans S7.3]|uniref:C2H2-type domain-containing protein n=1 Tax=Serpula lacrymans var. lacrymans (strain S7.3) TaxID=936435 RepID=F8QJQ0_SERL3|nr:hypothetical protein SERLA73DRAFT_157550 [Serpula lacrymans var. lacrymans S7.3]
MMGQDAHIVHENRWRNCQQHYLQARYSLSRSKQCGICGKTFSARGLSSHEKRCRQEQENRACDAEVEKAFRHKRKRDLNTRWDSRTYVDDELPTSVDAPTKTAQGRFENDKDEEVMRFPVIAGS